MKSNRTKLCLISRDHVTHGTWLIHEITPYKGSDFVRKEAGNNEENSSRIRKALRHNPYLTGPTDFERFRPFTEVYLHLRLL